MNSFLAIMLFFTAVSGACLFFYWTVAFPCVVLKARLSIQRVCDDIHIAVWDGKISSESRGFIVLTHYLDLGRRAARHADMLPMVAKTKMSPVELKAMETEFAAIEKDAPEIRDAFSTLCRWIVALWLAARPMHLLILGPLLVLAVFSDWADKKADREKKGGFVAAAGLPA
jgi:hypothetical protein